MLSHEEEGCPLVVRGTGGSSLGKLAQGSSAKKPLSLPLLALFHCLVTPCEGQQIQPLSPWMSWLLS